MMAKMTQYQFGTHLLQLSSKTDSIKEKTFGTTIFTTGGRMKKLAICLLCFTMTLNSFAATAGSEDFIQIFDEYQY